MTDIQNSEVFVIEGNIGSGKSTLLKLINEKMIHIQTIKEPVMQWQAINNDPKLNLLEAFYSDPKRYAYTFQSYAYYTRLKQWSEMEITSDIAIAERSVLSDKYIFGMNGMKSGLMNELEWALYNDYFDWLTSKYHGDKVTGIIYVNTEPELCQQRISKRGREEEKESIPLEYLKQLHDRHEEWLMCKDSEQQNIKYPLLVIDGSQDFEKDEKQQQIVMEQIEDFIKKFSQKQN